jgi:2-polyprenyl-6-methoxyphenol hydroxylase-like FAD-dependent oxidoreductase
VVLVGDAAHCASPYSGMGTSGGLVGAYVLAGEITRNADDLPKALANYDATLRPFVDAIQAEVKPRLLRLAMPKSRLAIGALHHGTALACLLRVPELVGRFSKSERGGDWLLPHYGSGAGRGDSQVLSPGHAG